MTTQPIQTSYTNAGMGAVVDVGRIENNFDDRGLNLGAHGPVLKALTPITFGQMEPEPERFISRFCYPQDSCVGFLS